MVVGEGRTYFVDDINERLGVTYGETTDRFTLIPTRANRLDQGREFMRSKRAFDQASAS